MKNSEYPSTAIVLEIFFGLIGLIGIGHIYAGAFFSGILVLFAYISLLFFEFWLITSALFPFKISLVGLISIIFAQNLLVSVESSKYVMNRKSRKFAGGFCVLMGFLLLILFLFFEITQEDKNMRMAALVIFILSLLFIQFTLKANTYVTEKEEKQKSEIVNNNVAAKQGKSKLGPLVMVLTVFLVLSIIANFLMGYSWLNSDEDLKNTVSKYNMCIDEKDFCIEENAGIFQGLPVLEERLRFSETNLNLTKKTLNSTQAQLLQLGPFCEALKGERYTLEENLTYLKQEVQKWTASYNDKKKDLDVCQNSAKLKEEQISKKDAKISYMALKGKEASGYFNQTDENLFFVKKDLEDLSSEIDDLYMGTGDLKVPEEISADAQNNIKNEIDDLRSYIRGKLSNAITFLGNSISNGKRSISSIGSA